MSDYAVTSEVLTAGLIVAVEVVRADLGAWEPEPGTTLQRRTGTLEVRVLEVLTGRLRAAAGEAVTLEVVERSSGSRIGDYYGLWSHVPTLPGSRLVAICDAASTDLRVALTEEHCDQLVEAAGVLDDLRLTLRLHRRHLTADRLLAEAERERGTGGAAFARYVWVAAREALRASAERFDALMRIAEDPATRIEAQETYLVSAYEDLTFTGSFPAAHRARLARAMLRSALDPRLGELREHLLTTYVPNLVAVPQPEPLTPDDVFAPAPGPEGERTVGERTAGERTAGEQGDAELRAALRTELADPRDPATTSPALLGWLTAGDEGRG
ncbi:hypothetical protein [Pengzhenrongella sicca]|uniref:Uncharacterized protein n=1 Tax=Pengzhenrongella sicca TaxID=2819238 RepID=A0A8A4ZIW4_9MICO|nr:hypothetical protein [Pengzhenrongella sicca]QTE31205.1 hypothetical protein J4E96_09965 [Pengzhenrongella sicca]